MSQSDNKIRILLCGDVEGRFNNLFNRVDAINKKNGPFELLLCVGNFFGINNKEFDAYRSGAKKVPVPTYVLGANKEDHVKLFSNNSDELCSNVYYLGKRGLYLSSGGLKIAYLSGISKNPNDKLNEEYAYNFEDAQTLKDLCLKGDAAYRGVDILLTSQWPNNVMNGDINGRVALKEQLSSDLVAWLALMLRPRYHVSGLEGVYYERKPYRISSPIYGTGDTESVTRFIGLARVGNPNKDKWLYALNLTPVDKLKVSEIYQKTTDETSCPYNLDELNSKLFKTNHKRKVEGNQYFYDMTEQEDAGRKFKHPRKQRIEFDKSKCWFCLASPSVEKHLVVTVGNSTYLALAKGGLVEEHFLICPIEHYQSSVGQPEEVFREVEEFKTALSKFYARNNQVPVFFERNYKTSHMQIQAVPVPSAAETDIENIFKDEAEGNGFNFETLESHNNIEQVIKPGSPYFLVQLPTGMTLYTRIQGSNKGAAFPLNFGREVLATGPVLNMCDRADWKDCTLSKEEEEKLVSRIRNDFAPYDFTEDA